MNQIKAYGAIFVAVILIIFGLNSFGNVPVGFNGVEECASHLTGNVVSEGIHIKAPWCTFRKQSIGNNQYVVENAYAVSNQQQAVHTDVDVTWTLNPAHLVEIQRKYRGGVQSIIIAPNVAQALRQATAQYSNTDLTVKRSLVQQTMENILRDRLKPYNNDVQVVQLSLTNYVFEKGYMDALERKAIAGQELLTQQTNVQVKKAEADQQIALARGIAESQALQQRTITPLYVQLEAIKKWNGELPTVSSGSGMMLDVNSLFKKQ